LTGTSTIYCILYRAIYQIYQIFALEKLDTFTLPKYLSSSST